MQQVAAINSEIASPGIHASNASKQSSKGMGDEFAQFLNNSNQNSGSEFRGHENRTPASAQSTATQTNSSDTSDKVQVEPQEPSADGTETSALNNSSDSRSQESETQTNSESEQATTGADQEVAEQTLVSNETSGDTESSVNDDPHHDQWISILQKLNGEHSVQAENTEQAGNLTEDSSAVLVDADVQHIVASDEQKPLGAPVETEKEVAEEVSGLDMWKQELRDKLLNASGELNVHQQKNMEQKLASLSEDEIRQLLNDDKSLRDMVTSILNTEEPDPQDLALLLALAEQNNDELYNSVSITDLIAGQTSTQQSETESEDSETDAFLVPESENTEGSENADIPEELLNAVLVEDVTTDVREGEEPVPEPDPEVDLEVESPTVNLSENPVTTHAQVAEDAAEKPEKVTLLNLNQLLNDLEQNLQSAEEKILAVENLTKRIESADVGKTPAGQKFLESLKNTLQEYKSQLKDGHEPAINLNKMMTDAMVADSAQVDALALENQMKQALQQMVNVAQAHQSMDSGARESLLSTVQSGISANNISRENVARDNATSQVDLAKSQQAQNQAQVMDKAINIVKPEAAQELVNKVQVMMNQRNMVADIRLDPPDLGQMQIRITMQGDTASVSMVVQSQAAREALEHNQPRLKELLEQQGIELGQSSVQEEGRGDAGQGEQGELASGGASGSNEDVDGNEAMESMVAVDEPEGIDYFA